MKLCAGQCLDKVKWATSTCLCAIVFVWCWVDTGAPPDASKVEEYVEGGVGSSSSDTPVWIGLPL